MKQQQERGFSMVEVVLALGLLAGVLISIAGLFVIGGRQLSSGRNHTEALSVAQDIHEEMNRWGFHQTWDLFGIDGSTVRATDVDSLNNSYAQRWQPTIDETLFNGVATIRFESLGPPSPPPVLESTRAIKVVVTVSWDEGGRSRQIELGNVRM